MDIEGHGLEMFQLLMELFVAEQKPLGELNHPIETIDQVFNPIQHLLIIFNFRLLLHNPLRHRPFDPRSDTFELNRYIFFDDFSFSCQFELFLREGGQMKADSFDGRVDFFIAIGQVEHSSEFRCFFEGHDLMSGICMGAQSGAEGTDGISAAIAVADQFLLWMKSAETIHGLCSPVGKL
jgi:hypothetical protein